MVEGVLGDLELGLDSLKALPPGMRPIWRGRGPFTDNLFSREVVAPFAFSAAFMSRTDGCLLAMLEELLMLDSRLGVGPASACAP